MTFHSFSLPAFGPNRRKIVAAAVMACGVLLVAISLASIAALRIWTGLFIPVPTASTASIGFDDTVSTDADRARFRDALRSTVDKLPAGEPRVLAILDWTMAQVGRVEPFETRSSWEMVARARAGRGLLCGGMARIFHDALISNGIPARIVLMRRDNFNKFDTHATVEAYVGGAWRVYDPTFHITLNRGGRPTGIYDARLATITGEAPPVTVVNLGATRYPRPFENYYIRYPALLNDVYIHGRFNIFGIGLPIAYYCTNCGVGEQVTAVYFAMILAIIGAGAVGTLLLTVGAVGFAIFVRQSRRAARDRIVPTGQVA